MLSKVPSWFYVLVLVLLVTVVSLLTSRNPQHTTSKESEFGNYPIEKYVDYRLDADYWNLPEFKKHKFVLARTIKNLHSVIAAFHENRLDQESAYRAILESEEELSSLMLSAFKRSMPPDGSLQNKNYAHDELKLIYDYRLPTLEETDKNELWTEYVRQRNIYVSSLNLLDAVVEQAAIDAIFTAKRLGVPVSTLSFNIYVNGELKRLSEIINNK